MTTYSVHFPGYPPCLVTCYSCPEAIAIVRLLIAKPLCGCYVKEIRRG